MGNPSLHTERTPFVIVAEIFYTSQSILLSKQRSDCMPGHSGEIHFIRFKLQGSTQAPYRCLYAAIPCSIEIRKMVSRISRYGSRI